MSTSEQMFRLVRTSKSSWVAVHVNADSHGPDGTIYSREPDATLLRNGAPAPGRLFSHSAKTEIALPERFPKLMIALIAASLLAVSITAEIEFMRHAGYFWN